ncbi:MAG: mitochondrial fission ELM1 family protein [Candidatus Omnitrophica bacterium]|nr:mitochondrial fission ELM1 family protein [Candidatus Omnitrophota bacterium]
MRSCCMTDYLGYILVKVFSVIFCLLPVRFGLFMGRHLGYVVYLINAKRRRVAYTNLKAAFSAQKDPGEIRAIVRGVYRHLGQVLIEMLRFPVIDRGYIDRFISVTGLERVEEARAANKGSVMLTGHFGNWELLSLLGGFLGFSPSLLAREQRHTRLNELLNTYRSLSGSRIIKKGLAARELIRALKSNSVIGMLGDQDAGKFGAFTEFFGRPASTHSGAFIFAHRTGARLLPAFFVREKGPRHRLEILKPIELNGADPKEAISSAIAEFSGILESFVRRFPEQWLWVHKRWKSTPRRSIVILSDGKQGHLNQSVAVARIMQKFRNDRGYKETDTVYRVIDVRHKSRAFRFLLTACAKLIAPLYHGGMAACMKLCLEKASYESIIHAYADIVISCGSSTAPANIFLSRELNARNIVIMNPGALGLGRFKLAIVPAHDKPKKLSNVLVTMGSPNGITDEVIQKEAARFLSFLDLKKRLRIGLVLGGDNPDYVMEEAAIRQVISQIKHVSEKLDSDILATTSRRTPRAVEQILKEELAGFRNSRLLIIANEKNIDGAIPAILGLCQVVLVSGESVSMISEAASSGKSVLVFPIKKKGSRPTRHETMVRDLSRMGIVKGVRPDEIGGEIENAARSGEAPKRLNDSERIYNAVGGLL